MKKQKFRRQFFLLSIPYLVFLSLMRFGLIRFQTNDDPGYFLISNGTSYQKPSSELLFPGRLVGIFIASLERILPGTNWYPLIMALSILIAVSLLTYCFLLLPNFDILNNKIFFSYLLLLLYACQFIYRMQFTQTAFFVAFIGAFSLINFYRNRLISFIGTASIICGISWRIEAGVLGVLFAVFFYLVGKSLRIQTLKTKKSVIVKVFFITILSSLINYALWNKYAPWLNTVTHDYLTYDYYRGIVHGSRYLSSSQSVIDAAKLDISANDWQLFRGFYTANLDVFSLERMKILAANAWSPKIVFSTSTFLFFIENVIRANIVNLCLIFFIGFSLVREYSVRKYLVFWLLVFVPITLIFLRQGMPSRLFVPIVLAAGVYSIFYSFINERSVSQISKQRINDPFFSIIVYTSGLFLLFFISSSLQREHQNIQNLREIDSILSSTREFVSDKPIISFPSFYSPLVNINPFLDVSKSLKIWPLIIPIGTSIGTPDFNFKVSSLGLSQDLFGSVLEGKAYLGVTSNDEKEIVRVYFLEHYKVGVKFNIIQGGNSTPFQILKIKMD